MKIRLLTGMLMMLLLCHCDNSSENTEPTLPKIPSEEIEIVPNTGALIIVPESCFPDVDDKYIYSIVPGTAEWSNLTSFPEMREVSQLPDDVLKKISTLSLIRNFLDVPLGLKVDYEFAWNNTLSYKFMFDIVFTSYNSAIEILVRKDAAESLLRYYDAICLTCLEIPEEVALENSHSYDYQVRLESSKQIWFLYYLVSVEGFFAQAQILDQMNREDKQKAVAMLLEKYEQRITLWEQGILSKWKTMPGYEVMFCIMLHAEFQPVVDFYEQNQTNYIFPNQTYHEYYQERMNNLYYNLNKIPFEVCDECGIKTLLFAKQFIQ